MTTRPDTRTRRDLSELEAQYADPVKVVVLALSNYQLAQKSLGSQSVVREINTSDVPGVAARGWLSDRLARMELDRREGESYTRQDLHTETGVDPGDADLLMIGLANPASFPMVLNVLDICDVPFRRADRAVGTDPLVVVGGPGIENPEPFAEFLDVSVIGEGERAVRTLVEEYHRWRPDEETRRAFDARLGERDGLYVPSNYEFVFDGPRVTAVELDNELVEDPRLGREYLEEDVPTHHFCAPFSDGESTVVVSNRGCRHNCHFCHLADIPYREYDVETVMEYVEEAVDAGIDELFVNSPSFTQHSKRTELLESFKRISNEHDVKIVLGSVRLDEVDQEYIDQLRELSETNHTFFEYTDDENSEYLTVAPEVTSERLRMVLNKEITDEEIFEFVDRVSPQPVNLNLYFLVGIGADHRRIESKAAFIERLCRRSLDHHERSITVNLFQFMPTPNTVAQRLPMAAVDEVSETISRIVERVKEGLGPAAFDEHVRVNTFSTGRLLYESFLMRGDRRVGEPLVRLYRRGIDPGNASRADVEAAFEDAPVEYDEYRRAFSPDEPVPWEPLNRITGARERQFLEAWRAFVDDIE